MNDTASGGAGPDYSATLFLPETTFPMRAGLPDREPTWLARWEAMDIYQRQRMAGQNKPKFTLHDGPPYANGNIHIGHALNKILKDLVTRSKTMLGYNSAYVPGWDCHGLPIEWKVEEQYRAKGKNKDDVEINEFRNECRSFAQFWVDTQREEFKRLGVVGDWANPYLTMSFDAEAQIARELHKIAVSGQLYRGSKPVMWSVVERTALAEAEIEYADYESDTIWVKFPVVQTDLSKPWDSAYRLDLDHDMVRQSFEDRDRLVRENACVVIWTTTPWTIPANRAISFSSKISYGLYEVTQPDDPASPRWATFGQKYVLADNLAADVFSRAKVDADGFLRLRDVPPTTLACLVCEHPLRAWIRDNPPVLKEDAQFMSAAEDALYGFPVPLLAGEHVTDEVGTGFVHTAPGHGLDDFDIWLKSARVLAQRGIENDIPFTVDDSGFLTSDAPGFEGARVIDDTGKKGDANNRVIAALAERGMMVARGRVKHQYPHSWRSKKPIIYRNTPQWFVYMDRDIMGKAGDTLRTRSLAAIDATKFYPQAGQNRLRSMIAERPDWVLSRQRAWGVPIAVFYNEKTDTILKDEVVNQRIGQAFEEEGADAWFKPDAKARFLEGAKHEGQPVDPAEWTKIDDILDVWFESGTTHSWVLRNKQKWPDLQFPAGMYLEGSDQHRGWFHSSLLESCATNGFAPYASVLTHGFTLDGEGKKMSKSLGNTTAPQDVIKQYGADILRLWVAQSDYSDDLRIGKDIINSTVDNYRKLRNSIRWLLGNLAHRKAGDEVPVGEMDELERVVLHRLKELDTLVREAYDSYDYKRVVAALSNFMNIDLSAFYFDIRKDALYCDPISSVKRRGALTVLEHVFDALTAWLAPILVFTTEEAWLERHPGDQSSVHLREFPTMPAEWLDAKLAAKWEKVREVRKVVTGALEIERKNKVIGASMEAAPKVFVANADLLAALDGVDLAEIAITSGIAVSDAEGPAEAFRLEEVPGVAVVFEHATGRQCARSRRFFAESEMEGEVSKRDAQALRERAEAGL